MKRWNRGAACFFCLLVLAGCAASPRANPAGRPTAQGTPAQGPTEAATPAQEPSVLQLPPFGATAPAPAEAHPASTVLAPLYGKGLLPASGQSVYAVLERMGATYDVEREQHIAQPLTQAEFAAVWDAWKNDAPQVYWAVPRTVLNAQGDVAGFAIEVEAPLTLEEVRRRQQEIDAAAAQLLEGLSGDGFEAAWAIHDRLIAATDYAREPGIDDAVNLYGTLVNRLGVCNGLSRAYQYLTQKCGLESIYIHGTTPWGSTHAWNAVKLPDGWYYVDVTWDRNRERSEIFHDYLLVSWEEISREHIPRAGQYAVLPQQTGAALNYYVKHGFFAREPETDARRLAEAFVNELSGKPFGKEYKQYYSEVKILARQASYEVTRNYFIKNMFEVVAAVNKVAEERGLPWRVRETGSVVVDYNDAAAILSILLYAKNI